MEKNIDTILRLPYSLNNVDKLVDLINDAKKVVEINKEHYSYDFLFYLQHQLMLEVQQLISDKKKYMNTVYESLIIASFMTLKMGIHHILSTKGHSKIFFRSMLF